MNERQVIVEILKVLKTIVSELEANDRDTPQNLREIESEIDDIAERFQNDKT